MRGSRSAEEVLLRTRGQLRSHSQAPVAIVASHVELYPASSQTRRKRPVHFSRPCHAPSHGRAHLLEVERGRRDDFTSPTPGRDHDSTQGARRAASASASAGRARGGRGSSEANEAQRRSLDGWRRLWWTLQRSGIGDAEGTARRQGIPGPRVLRAGAPPERPSSGSNAPGGSDRADRERVQREHHIERARGPGCRELRRADLPEQ
jgi:hypothetical protein